MAELSVLIVNYNSWAECAQAIATLRQHGPTRPDGSPMPCEVIVVDNCSPQKAPQKIELVERELRRFAEQQGDPAAGRLIRHDENGGYSKGMNLAFAHSRGRWILVSNPDVLFSAGLLPALQRHLENDPKAGIVVPKGFWDPVYHGHLPPNTLPTLGDAWGEVLCAYSAGRTRRRAKKFLRRWLAVWQAERPLALPMMSGCLFLVERAYFESIGRFDERYPLYYEDADLSISILRSGRTITQVPDARLVHFVNRSGMSDLETMWARNKVSKERYYDKWYGWLGRLTMKACHWLATNPRFEKWRRVPPEPPYTDLGETDQKPVLQLPRRCERYVVLLSMDMRFFLAAGCFGSGDAWTPSDESFAVFVNANYYFQVYDLSGGEPEHLGTWRYYCQRHLGHSVRPVVEAGAAP
ncbi:MAG: glycosyltransferase [Planctomycetes bacterium]|nr:glycosyltransferase [Planctomycetota bacterium]